MQKLIILTGVSGAGKSTIGHVFEEKNYRMVSNVPPTLIPAFLDDMVKQGQGENNVVLVCMVGEALPIIKLAKADNRFVTKVFALGCKIDELRSRYRLTRHVHPLEASGLTLEQCLEKDKREMDELRPYADLYIDTSNLASNDLRKIAFTSLEGSDKNRMALIFASFGYKYGVPQDAEIVFDTRTVPNPFWVKGLRDLTGLDKEVIDFLEGQAETAPLLKHMEDYLDYYLEELSKEGRNFVFIDVGCSGGQHRSVYFAQKLYDRYKEKYLCSITHRELPRYIKERL